MVDLSEACSATHHNYFPIDISTLDLGGISIFPSSSSRLGKNHTKFSFLMDFVSIFNFGENYFLLSMITSRSTFYLDAGVTDSHFFPTNSGKILFELLLMIEVYEYLITYVRNDCYICNFFLNFTILEPSEQYGQVCVVYFIFTEFVYAYIDIDSLALVRQNIF